MRFADPNAVDTFEVACPCPGTPHEVDRVTHRTQLGSGEIESAGAFGWQRGLASAGVAWYDSAAALSMLIHTAVVRWTFTDADAEPLPVTVRAAELLPESIRDRLRAVTNDAQSWEQDGPDPNSSGAPSPNTSRASASRPRATRTKR